MAEVPQQPVSLVVGIIRIERRREMVHRIMFLLL
jgi:hypothetical protein